MILKTSEASKYIGVSINTLKTLANNERIKSFKTAGGHRRFMQEDLDCFTGKVTEKQVANSRGYVKKSRLTIEQALGRYLTPEEIVHHINKIRDDDRIDNLMAFVSHSAHRRFHYNSLNVKPEEIILAGLRRVNTLQDGSS